MAGDASDGDARLLLDADRLRRRLAVLDSQVDVARAVITAGNDYAAALATAARRIAEALGDCCTIRLLSDDGQWLSLVGLYVDNPEITQALRDALTPLTVPVDGQDLMARVARDGESLLIPVMTSEQVRPLTSPQVLSIVERFRFHSAIVVPLRVGGQGVGALAVSRYRTEHPPFAEADLALVQDLAEHVAFAISHARLVTRVQDELAERKRSEAALEKSEERFAKAFHSNPQPMAITHQSDGRYLDVNESFLRLAECTREQAIGRTSLDLGLINAEARAAVMDEQREHGTIRHVEAQVRSTTGWQLTVLISAENTELAGEPCTLWTVVDITERKRAEEALAKVEAELRHVHKMEAVGRLAGGIAHDFNNILSAMIMQLDLLRSTPDVAPAALRREVDGLSSLALRAAGLVKQLLLFSRQQPLDVSRRDVNVIVGALMQMLERVLGEDVTLSVERCDEPLWVECDAGMIEQVVTNLCTNARDAMPHGGRLTVATRSAVPASASHDQLRGGRAGRFACIQVSDTGSGMDAALLEHIFEPFFTTKPVGQATGLGLSTVHGIVAKHGGMVEVESVVGSGSSFRVYLPSVEAGEPRAAPAAPPTPAVAAGRGPSILVVEDEPALRNILVRTLRSRSYRVVEAESGVDALRIWTEEGGRFDLVLTDMVMPGGISGADLCVRLRQLKPDLKVIISSGYSAGLADDPGLAVAATFLAKPYDVATVLSVVGACLEQPQPPPPLQR